MPDDINQRIARRIKELRNAKEMTLEQLAQRSGVSRAMLSLIERGESNPTAVLLDKVATALGIVLASLFENSTQPANPLIRASQREAWRDPASGYQRWNVSPPNYPSPIKLVKVILPAGAKVSYDTNAHEPAIYQQIWVQHGSLRIHLGKQVYLLETDDCFAMRLNQPITYENPSQQAIQYVVAIANDSWQKQGI